MEGPVDVQGRTEALHERPGASTTVTSHDRLAQICHLFYQSIRDRLAQAAFLRDWLRKKTQDAPDSCITASERYWGERNWDLDSAGRSIALASADATSLFRSFALIIAIQFGRTVRAVVSPTSTGIGFLRRGLLLYGGEGQWDGLSEEQARRVVHSQINLTYAMTRSTETEPTQGMLASSLQYNAPLYCGDAARLGDRTHRVAGSEIQFVSAAQNEEAHLGIASVAYLPLQIPFRGRGSADMVLGLYSPYLHVFGHADEPLLLDIQDLAPQVQEALDSPAMEGQLESLRLLSDLFGVRTGVPMKHAVAIANCRIKSEHPPEQLIRLDAILNSPERADPICVAADEMTEVLASVFRATAEKLERLRFECQGLQFHSARHGVVIAQREVRLSADWQPQSSQQTSPGDGDKRLYFELKQLVDNALQHGSGTASLSVSRSSCGRAWIVRLSNTPSSSYDHVLLNYWIVRQGHFPAFDTAEDIETGGLGLFGMQVFAASGMFGFKVNLTVPTAENSDLRWETMLRDDIAEE